MSLWIYDGEVPCLGIIEGVHGLLHGHCREDFRRRGYHEFGYMEAVVKLGSKHDVANVIEEYESHQTVLFVYHGEYISTAFSDYPYYISQHHLGSYGAKLRFDNTIEVHQSQYGLILLVGEQFTLFCQAQRVDTVTHEDPNGAVGTKGNEHKGEEEIVSS